MQRVDNVLRVVLNNVGVSEDWNPIILAALGCFDAVHGEATGETSHAAKDGFEGLGKVMRDEVSVGEFVSVCSMFPFDERRSPYSNT